MGRIRHTGGHSSILTAKRGPRPPAYDPPPFQPLNVLPQLDLNALVGGNSGFVLRPDGRRLYVIRPSFDDIAEIELTVPGLISSGVLIDSYPLASISTGEGLWFRPNGLSLYVTDVAGALIFQYNLSSPWDLSTLTTPAASKAVSPQNTAPAGLVIKPDGTKLLMVGRGGSQRVYEYTLSTPWLISTATYTGVNSFLSPEYGLAVSPDGTQLFHPRSSESSISHYALGTPWAVGGTNTAINRMFATNPRWLFYSDDGKVLYIKDNVGVIRQFGGV